MGLSCFLDIANDFYLTNFAVGTFCQSRHVPIEGSEKGHGCKDKGKGSEVAKRRSDGFRGLRSLNSFKLRRIEGNNFLHSWQERQLNERTGLDDDMQRTPGSHKAAQTRRTDTHSIQGVSDRPFGKKKQ